MTGNPDYMIQRYSEVNDELIAENENLRKQLAAWQYAGRDLIHQLAANIDQHADITFYVPKENGYQDSFVLWHNMHNKRADRTYKAFKRLFDLLAKKG